MKIAITITARMKSTRLPLKVMRYIKDKPMIEQMIDRLKLSNLADEIILCTSTNPQDEILIDIAKKNNIKYFRGSEEDVLDRLFNAAKKNNVDFIVSATADNPLTDFEQIDKIIQTFKDTNADYIKAWDLPLGTFAYGLKVEALERVIETKKEKNTEVWGRIIDQNESFKKINLEVSSELKHPELRLTVDTPEDLEVMKIVFDNFYINKNNFKLKGVVNYLLKNPEITKINSKINQKIN